MAADATADADPQGDGQAFFNPDWYAWQNPDWARAHPSPFAHYMAVGRFENRDPAPNVDMKRYGEMVGDAVAPEHRLEAICNGLRSPAFGVYDSWADLDAVQREFFDAIVVTRGRDGRPADRRRNLVLLQAGPGSRHREWFDRARPRNWDLLVNYYDARGYDPEFGDAVYFQAGTKFTAVANFLARQPELLGGYRHLLLLDDDILVSMPGLDALFDACAANGLDLAQMALSDRSSCIWECLFARGRRGLRRLNCVEIMMPVLSARALGLCAGDFRRSISGFGLDLLMGKRVAAPDHRNIAVIDDVVAEHLKPIDDAGGAYYAYLRSRLINPKAELWRLVEEFGLDCEIREVV